jgi:hypothetical protein
MVNDHSPMYERANGLRYLLAGGSRKMLGSRKLPRRRKMLMNRTDSRQSGARGVRQPSLGQAWADDGS